jgi:hypothetical protein
MSLFLLILGKIFQQLNLDDIGRNCLLGHGKKIAVVGKMTTFDLWPRPLRGGAWGAGTNMWRPETPASYESLPDPLATQIPTLWILTSGGRGRGGALILDRCRAFDLFASVDAHLWKIAKVLNFNEDFYLPLYLPLWLWFIIIKHSNSNHL